MDTKTLFTGISQAFRLIVPGVLVIVLLRLSHPNLYRELSALADSQLPVWAVFVIACGMMSYAAHRTCLLLLDFTILFRTRLTAAHVFRRPEEHCHALGPWAGFLLYRFPETPRLESAFGYLESRWSHAHFLCIVGELLIVSALAAQPATPVHLYRLAILATGSAIFILGFVALLILFKTEARLATRDLNG